MTAYNKKTHWRTIIVGGGQAGLVTGYQLQCFGEEFLIIDASDKIGGAWRDRWDSLKLFTPNWANGLPGLRFPGRQKAQPGKDEMADYLLAYAEQHRLPILSGTRAVSLEKTPHGYRLLTSSGLFTCDNVVVANGNFARPKIPSFARLIRPSISQIHSSRYKRPSDLPAGNILVAGAATSGLQIAIDIAGTGRKAYLSGNPPAKIPPFILKHFGRQFVWAAQHILTIHTPMGRKMAEKMRSGLAAPLINVSLKDAVSAGAEHVPKVKGATGGLPALEDGQVLDVAAIVWCTGLATDFSWIKMDGVENGNGSPIGCRGVSENHKGLYFMGMMFQYSLSSTSINGMGQDALHIARHIHKNSSPISRRTNSLFDKQLKNAS